MREMALVQSSGWNVAHRLGADRLVECPGERGRQGHSPLGVDDPIPAPTSVIQSKDRVSGESTNAGTNRLAAGCRCQEYGTSFQSLASPKR